MRYVVLVLLGAFGVILNGSLVTGLSIAGISVDLVLLIVVSLALVEKTSMPIIFAACAGLLMDIMYSPVLGIYAISYTVVATVVVMALRKVERYNPVMLFVVGAGGYFLKELVTALLIGILGYDFPFGKMLVRYILPGALLSGALIFVGYGLISMLFRNHWMKPRPAYKNNDFL